MPNPLVEKIRDVVTPPAEAAGYEVVDVEWKREQSGWVLRLFVDKPSGVSHSDCERLSREISAVLDVHDLIPHAYSLEVSSPGLNRPLRTIDHFRRFVGQQARVRLRIGTEGRRNFVGTITGVDDTGEKVILKVDGQEFALPLADLDKASLEYRFK
ncbi:MAG: ribosome maturation factor RimP [Deltaproteobacteria bacterium]|nr:ribosome maturation factor RimP [Deltaproteobacteria bacterium]